MKYILTEEELYKFIQDNFIPETSNTISLLDNFLKSKQPVEEIASGEVSEHLCMSCLMGKENDYVKFDDLFRYLIGKNIKIYVEVL